MSAAGAVLVAEAVNLIAELRKGRGGGSSGETGTDDDDFEFPLVGRVDEF